MSAEVVDELALARAEFDRWRSHSSGRGRIPSHPWELAMPLVSTHGVTAIARELGLNQGRLRARLRQESTAVPKRRASKPRFVELRPAALLSPVAERAAGAPHVPFQVRARLRIDRLDAVSLTLELAADRSDLVERLVAAFARTAS
jgi:hypothetical protein